MKQKIYSLVSLFMLSVAVNAQNIDINQMPKPGPTPVVNITNPKTFKLNNGLTVLVVEDSKLPRVNTTLSIDRPPVFEGEKAGVNSIMSQLLGSGTDKISKDDFNKRIDFLGASINYNETGAFVNTLSKYYPEVLQLFASGVTNAKFTQQELDKAKDRALENLKAEEKNAPSIAERVFRALTYGKNSASGEFMTEKTIKAITLADVNDVYSKYYAPNNAYLVIIGDVKFDNVKKLVENSFNSWKKSSVKFPKVENVKNLTTTEINVVDIPTASQSVIYIGNVTDFKMNNPQYFAANTANYILGGGSLESRVNMNLREKNAFTYGAYTSLDTNKYYPHFRAEANVRGEVTDRAIQEFINEINGIKTIKPEELQNAKQKLKGSFIMAMEKPETIARFALNKITQNLPDTFYTDYLKSVDAMTLQQVQDASKNFINPKNLRIFVAGKASDFADKLEKLGYPVKYFDAQANPTVKPEIKKVDNSVTIATVADNYFKVIGGKEKAAAINSITMESVTKTQGMEITIKTIQAKGAKSKMEVTAMGQVVQRIVFDGNAGFMEAQGQKMPLPEEMANAMKKDKEVFPELLFANSSDYKLSGIEKLNGEDCYVVKGNDNTLYYSVASGLKVGEVKKQGGTEAPTYYSNYKDVEGVKMPFTIKISQMGQEMQMDVKSYQFNKATDSDFK